MFRNTFQKGFLSVFQAGGSRPLLIWDTKVKNGHIRRLTDNDLNSLALEICGLNVATSFITAPKASCDGLGIKLPFLIIVVKNMRKPFSMEIQILDDHNQLRRFRTSNFQSKTRVSNFSTNMPLVMNCGWNQIVLNLADFTNRVYKTNYMETVRITINATCRLKNIYFCDRIYSDEETPNSFKFTTRNVDKTPAMSSKVNLKSPSLNIQKKVDVEVMTKDENIEETSRVHEKVMRPTSPVTEIQSTEKHETINENFEYSQGGMWEDQETNPQRTSHFF